MLTIVYDPFCEEKLMADGHVTEDTKNLWKDYREGLYQGDGNKIYVGQENIINAIRIMILEKIIPLEEIRIEYKGKLYAFNRFAQFINPETGKSDWPPELLQYSIQRAEKILKLMIKGED